MSRIRFQAKAHGLLMLKGKWLKSAFILLLIFMLIMGFAALDNAFYAALGIQRTDQYGVPALSAASFAIEGAFTLLLLLFLPPLFAGQTEWYWAMSEGRAQGVGEVFGWFGSLKLYLKSVGLSLNIFWRVFLWAVLTCFIPAGMLTAAYTFYYPVSVTQMSLRTLVFILLVMFGWILLLGGLFLLGYLSMRYFLAFFLFVEDSERRGGECLRNAIRYSKGRRWEMYKFCLSFIPWFLLCYFVVPAFVVLPYFNASSAVLARHVIFMARGAEKNGAKAA